MAEVVARTGIVVVALAVIAALAVQLRAHDLLAHATEVATKPKPTPAQVDAQLRHLKVLQKLRPGSQPFLAAASLELRIGRYGAAARAAKRATQREPKNFSAWVTLAVALAQTGDKRGIQAAYVRAHVLNPLYPIPH